VFRRSGSDVGGGALYGDIHASRRCIYWSNGVVWNKEDNSFSGIWRESIVGTDAAAKAAMAAAAAAAAGGDEYGNMCLLSHATHSLSAVTMKKKGGLW
jgi:cytochrome c5